jgi:type VI secretion system protein ImpK
MASTPVSPVSPPAPQTPRTYENLALVFQEILTVIVRIRANRQRVTDAEVFRNQILNAFRSAEQDGLRRGYTNEDLRVATFAVAAFLDESIFYSQNPVFADWARKPLNHELFGNNIAGEVFFRNLDRLLTRTDSMPLADLLEVHQLCLLLGFRGRYSAATGDAEIRSLASHIEEKIRRIRGTAEPLQQLPAEPIRAAGDPWMRILRWVALACVVVAILLFGIYKLSLSSSAGDLASIAARNTY